MNETSGFVVSRGDAILAVDEYFWSKITIHHSQNCFLSSRLLSILRRGGGNDVTEDGFVEESWDMFFNIMALELLKGLIFVLKYQNNDLG